MVTGTGQSRPRRSPPSPSTPRPESCGKCSDQIGTGLERQASRVIPGERGGAPVVRVRSGIASKWYGQREGGIDQVRISWGSGSPARKVKLPGAPADVN